MLLIKFNGPETVWAEKLSYKPNDKDVDAFNRNNQALVFSTTYESNNPEGFYIILFLCDSFN